MSQQAIKETIDKILRGSYVGPMATVKNNKPHSRYMTFFNEGFTLYTLTSKETDKAEEIKANPHTHILLGYEGEGFGDEYVEYEGKISFTNSDDLKKELWNDTMKLYFEGPEDPELVLLEINPIAIRVMNKKGEAPKELEL
ncbi:pyridoxamine 5'-phosphate oxidase family protein [Virgibacillus sp. NKC19-3]|uniref:pyridoxamine 5'-phosphate oxidase family protein n=1 Tax=Virgibacillus saliphilus TaxID=2831674 RepID=UPI001C9AE52B|nr:pyridoxamine 5'-phosphate oxidase family protein [Virgibacillus sp. NKC19-3]MBY7145026.1 pyridoxamine 5'-phosphate oxidase family protein [Virgibacillus sp. NKC19-3]